MCGLIGYISQDNDQDLKNLDNKFIKYFDKLKHRGPDFQIDIKHKLNNNEIRLGFLRLSIQDTSPNANKLFDDEEGTLLFNGEIYNKEYLKKNYLKDQKLETKSDTEILFYLIKKYKFNLVKKLEGIFSIAYLNKKEKKIYLIRDYTGTKPLYYSLNKKTLTFASEAWFLYSISEKELDIDACNYYFRFGFPPNDKTLIQNVFKVLPSEVLEYDIINKTVNSFNYSDTNSSIDMNKESETELSEDLENVVHKNLISDTKVGVFLSGGVDSSIIALTAKKYNSDIEAFTSIYESEYLSKNNLDFNTTKKLCADYDIKLNYEVIQKKDILKGDKFHNILNYIDEPISNLNLYSSYIQSQLASKLNFKVILTGDGSDEIFGGYKKYRTLLIAEKLKIFSILNKKINFYNNIDKEQIPYHFFSKLNNDLYKFIFKEDFFNKLITKENHKIKVDKNVSNNIQVLNDFDFKKWLPSETNLKLDRTTMANSVEGRVPFQDTILINKYLNYDFKNKISITKNKIMFEKSLKNIPDYVLKRKKQGWFLPEKDFLFDFFKDNIFELFSIKNYQTEKIFNFEKIYELYFSGYNRKFPRKELTTILMFKIWYDKVINC